MLQLASPQRTFCTNMTCLTCLHAVLMPPLHSKLRRPTSGNLLLLPALLTRTRAKLISVQRTEKDVTELASIHVNQANAKPEYERQHTWESFFFFPSASTSPYCKTCILQTLQKSLAEFMRWTSSVKVLEMNKASGISLLSKNEIWSSREGELEAIDPWFSLKLQSYRDFIVNHSTNDWKTEGSTIVLRSSSCSIVAASGPHWMEAQQKTGSCVLWAAQRNCPHELNTDPEYLDWRTCKTCELFVFFSCSSRLYQKVPAM